VGGQCRWHVSLERSEAINSGSLRLQESSISELRYLMWKSSYFGAGISTFTVGIADGISAD